PHLGGSQAWCKLKIGWHTRNSVHLYTEVWHIKTMQNILRSYNKPYWLVNRYNDLAHQLIIPAFLVCEIYPQTVGGSSQLVIPFTDRIIFSRIPEVPFELLSYHFDIDRLLLILFRNVGYTPPGEKP